MQMSSGAPIKVIKFQIIRENFFIVLLRRIKCSFFYDPHLHSAEISTWSETQINLSKRKDSSLTQTKHETAEYPIQFIPSIPKC